MQLWLLDVASTSAQNINVWGHQPSDEVSVAQGIAQVTQVTSPQVTNQRPYEQLICAYAWDCNKAIHIMECESTHNPRAYAASNYGLFQVNAIHIDMTPNHSLDDLYVPEINVDIAFRLYQSRGWQPWIVCGG